MGRLVQPISKEEYEKLPAWQRLAMEHFWLVFLVFWLLPAALLFGFAIWLTW